MRNKINISSIILGIVLTYLGLVNYINTFKGFFMTLIGSILIIFGLVMWEEKQKLPSKN